MIRIATRASALARWQAERVGSLLGRDVELVFVSTTGDRDQTSELHAIGGLGVFTKEVQQAVLNGDADVAVHSAKDLPTATPEGLVLAAVPERADPRDALVGCSFERLGVGARIGTGSVRRRAQLAAARPDLLFGPLRGNIATRLQKREELGYDAVVVAYAALERLGILDGATDVLDTEVMLPQVAQGALAAECRADDSRTLARLRAIDDPTAHRAVAAERAFLAELGGGCDLPCGALASVDERAGTIFLDALLASLDGHVVLRTRVAGAEPTDVGTTAARDLLDGKGGRALMEDVCVTVYLVGAGPGDPGLLTRRGEELLRAADVVVYDRLAPSALLELARPDAELVDVGKAPGNAPMGQDAINAVLVDRGTAGLEVVRLKGGDPFVFGRGGEEAEACIKAGIPFEIVPGITSAIAAAAYAGIPVTHRRVSTSFTVVTGHEDPTKGGSDTRWDALAKVGGTLVVLMGAGRIEEIAKALIDGGRDENTPVAAVRFGTRPDQRTIRATLGTIAAVGVESPSAIVVGDVAGLDFAWFEQRPLFGRTVVVTRAREQASELTARFVALGATVLEMPAIQLVALDFEVPDLESFDWLVFTSANGVDAFFDRGLEPRNLDSRALAPVRIAAIGPGTAAALSRRGLRADVVPERFVAESLLDAFPAGSGRVLIARAEAARDVLPEGLVAKGYEVVVLSVYRTIAAPPDADTLARLRPGAVDAADAVDAVDAITFTSSSTVDNFCAAVAGPLPEPQPHVVSIGPVTSVTARERGLRVDAEADPHTIDGLVEAVVRLLSK